MSEEIRKNELTDEQTEQVPGGRAVPPCSGRAVPPRTGESNLKKHALDDDLLDQVSGGYSAPFQPMNAGAGNFGAVAWSKVAKS